MWIRRVTTDRVLLVSILGLAGVAHFVPVFTSRFMQPGEVRFGWQFAHFVMGCLYELAVEGIKTGQRIRVMGGWYTIVGCLSNPLFWAGVAVLLLGERLSRQKAGIIAGLTGVAALLCTLGFLPSYMDVTLLPGFYFWLVSLVLLTVAGFWKATTANLRAGGLLGSRHELAARDTA